MKVYCIGFVIVCMLFGSSSTLPRARPLFNGKDLGGWETYIGPSYDSVQRKFRGTAPGLNSDPSGVFSVVSMDGSGTIRISGEHFGGISTVESFRNYHLRLQFKWGKKKWQPKKSESRDSGLLYHAVGPHAGDGNFWMRSQEFQIQEGDCGDYWGVAGAVADIPAVVRSGNEYIYNPSSPLLTFRDKTETGRHCIKNPDAEKKSGDWNTIELYCMGDTSVHIVNGVVNMILYNLRQQNGETDVPLKEGKIQIQSEGAEIFYRDISIEPIRQIPARILK
jgi:hypothetical protein